MDRPKYFEEYFVPPKRKTQERPPLWYQQVRLEPYTFEDDLDPLLNIILEDDEVLKFLKGSRFILLLLTLLEMLEMLETRTCWECLRH